MAEASRRAVLAGGAALTLGACGGATEAPVTAFAGLAEELAQTTFRDSPERASANGIAAERLGVRFETQLDDRRAVAVDARRAAALRWSAVLGGLEGSAIAAADRPLHRALKDHFTALVPLAELDFGRFDTVTGFAPYVFAGPEAAPFALADLFAGPPVAPDAAEARLARLEAAAGAIDAETRRARQDAERGIVAPAGVSERFARGVSTLLSAGLAAQPFLAAFPAASETAPAPKVTLAAQGAFARSVAPALRRAYDLAVSLRARAAAEDQGAARAPGGAEVYAALLAFHSAGRFDAQSAEAVAVREIEALDPEIDRTLALLGAGATGPRGERIAALAARPAYAFATPEAALAALAAALNTAAARAAAVLPAGGAQGLAVGPLPAHLAELAGPGLRMKPSYGAGPAVLQARPAALNRLTLPAIAAAEGAFGRAGLAAWTASASADTLWRKFGGARSFAAGWAVYAEREGERLGLYEQAPQRLGLLLRRRARAAALQVDVGLFAGRWTRAQALARLNEALAPAEAQATLDQVLAAPGAAAAPLALGGVLAGLRRQAEDALGQRFDAPRFHAMLFSLAEASPAALALALARHIAAPRAAA